MTILRKAGAPKTGSTLADCTPIRTVEYSTPLRDTSHYLDDVKKYTQRNCTQTLMAQALKGDLIRATPAFVAF